MPGLWQCRDGIDGAPTLQGTGARGPGTPRGRRCSLTSTSKAKSPRPRQTSSRLLPNLGQNSGLKHPSFQPAFVSLKTFTSKNFRFREKLQKVPRVPVSLSPSLPSSSRTSGPPPSGDEDPAPHPPPSSQIGDEDPPHPTPAALTSRRLVCTTARSMLQEGRPAVARAIASLSGAFCSCFFYTETEPASEVNVREQWQHHAGGTDRA